MRRWLCVALAVLLAFPFLAGVAEGQYTPCSKCHIEELTPVEAPKTIDLDACLQCHSPKYRPGPVDASTAHYAHSGVFPGGPGDIAKHPRSADAAAVGKDIGDCFSCHFKVVNEQCMLCHVASMPHAAGRTDCSACHGETPNVVSHVIVLSSESHANLGPVPDACFACHSEEKRDMFQLASGVLVDFDNPPGLCYQCHYNIYREWEAGEHPGGPTTSCTASGCHDPHEPEEVIKTAPIPEEVPEEVTRPELPRLEYVGGAFAGGLVIGALVAYAAARRR